MNTEKIGTHLSRTLPWVLTLILGVSPALGQPTITLTTELPGTNPGIGSYGTTLDNWGNLAIVGNSLSISGGVFVFSQNEEGAWQSEGEILAPAEPDLNYDRFGFAVAIGDQVALVSDFSADSTIHGQDVGVVFVFRRTPLAIPGQFVWLLEKRLEPSSPGVGDNFGRPLAIDGDRAMVGIYGSGVHVFERDEGGASNWGEVQILTQPTSTSFGGSLALRGSVAMVGSPNDTVDNQPFAGRAFLYKYNFAQDQWDLEMPLLSPVATEDETFGSDVAVTSWSSGGPFPIGTQRIIVGSWGTVYSWQKTSLGTVWNPQESLTAPSGFTVEFGTEVAGGSREMHVFGEHTNGDRRILSFERSDGAWTLLRKLRNLNTEPFGGFGDRISAHGDVLVTADASLEKAYVYDHSVFADGFESGDTSKWSSTANAH